MWTIVPVEKIQLNSLINVLKNLNMSSTKVVFNYRVLSSPEKIHLKR